MKSQILGRRRVPGAATVVGVAILAISGCANELPEGEPPPAAEPAIRLDAHAHLGSCDLFNGATICEADQSPQSCPDIASNLVVTSEQYLARYGEVSGSTFAQIASMAYQWSSPTRSDVDSDYSASEQEVANVECQNNYTVQQTSRYEGRLLPLCSVNPKKEYAVAEVDRCIDELGVSGLKLHFSSSQVDLRDDQTAEWVLELLQHAAKRDLPVLVHFGDLAVLCGECDAGAELDKQGMVDAMRVMLDRILPAAPGLNLTFAHLTGVGAFPDWTQATFGMLIDAYRDDAALQESDLYVDLSAVFNTSSEVNGNVPGVTDDDLAVLGEQLREWGLERTLWGSDLAPGAIAEMRSLWPLSDGELAIVAANTGAL